MMGITQYRRYRRGRRTRGRTGEPWWGRRAASRTCRTGTEECPRASCRRSWSRICLCSSGRRSRSSCRRPQASGCRIRGRTFRWQWRRTCTSSPPLPEARASSPRTQGRISRLRWHHSCTSNHQQVPHLPLPWHAHQSTAEPAAVPFVAVAAAYPCCRTVGPG